MQNLQFIGLRFGFAHFETFIAHEGANTIPQARKPWFEEDANLQSSYIFFKSFTHRRTLAHELAPCVWYARCHVAEEKENAGFISLTRMKSSIKM